MYGSWTANVVLWRIFLGIIWDLCIFFQEGRKFKLLNLHRLFIFKEWFWESVKKLLNRNDEKCSKNSTMSLFTNIFCRFLGIFIEKTTFEEFEESCGEIHKE